MKALALTLLLATTGQTLFASTMECYNGIIDSAEIDPPNKQQVRQRCGEPSEQNNEGTQWVYRQRKLSYTLSFDAHGLLTDIQVSKTQ